MAARRGKKPTPADSPVSMSTRYRLELVREPGSPYASPVECFKPERVQRFLRELLAPYDREVFGVLLLNARGQCIGHTIAYVGTMNRAVAEPRGVLVPALLAHATGVVLFHNHPSGDPEPSSEDVQFTRRVEKAGEIVGVRLVDHLILGEEGYVSLRERAGW